jgi:hypothetical protein
LGTSSKGEKLTGRGEAGGVRSCCCCCCWFWSEKKAAAIFFASRKGTLEERCKGVSGSHLEEGGWKSDMPGSKVTQGIVVMSAVSARAMDKEQGE